ncbi:hypothetical protein PR048_018560 [Dryococelus australis]|uniref:CCHC-type domain-containing protein n=1 Tax=Dryococelus australis TaxID=614101 RepID=A0ABQ9HCM1_9NEOP|nr:hypothetical protein PR048_018560 [Dryococelus australis]
MVLAAQSTAGGCRHDVFWTSLGEPYKLGSCVCSNLAVPRYRVAKCPASSMLFRVNDLSHSERRAQRWGKVSYAIGVAEPLSITVFDYGTAINKKTPKELLNVVHKNFDLRPGKIHHLHCRGCVHVNQQLMAAQQSADTATATTRHSDAIDCARFFTSVGWFSLPLPPTEEGGAGRELRADPWQGRLLRTVAGKQRRRRERSLWFQHPGWQPQKHCSVHVAGRVPRSFAAWPGSAACHCRSALDPRAGQLSVGRKLYDYFGRVVAGHCCHYRSVIGHGMVEGSRTRGVVNSFFPTAENYEKAIKCVQSRFGKKELLVEFYVHESLESLGVTGDQYAAFLFPLVESSLPEDILKENSVHLQNETLENLHRYKLSKWRGEKRVSLYQMPAQRATKSKMKEEENMAIASNLFSGDSDAFDNNRNLHQSKNCLKVQKMTLMEKNILMKTRCFQCLKQGHTSRACRTNVKCQTCERRHYGLLCPGLRQKITETTPENEVKEYPLSATLTNQSYITPVLDQPVICGKIPLFGKGPWLKELMNHKIFFSDCGPERPEIELLLGADTYVLLLTGRCGPVADETHFGWVVMGRLSTDPS